MIPTRNSVTHTSTPTVTLALIGICVAAFLYQWTLSGPEAEAFLKQYALIPRRYLDGTWAAAQGLSRTDPTPLLSNMFLHGGLLHIASNLWTLWVFGPALEERLGPARMLGLYLAAGIAAGLLHVVFNFSSPIPALGASGAIAGVIAAYARRFPYAWVNILQPIGLLPLFFMMPGMLFAGLWFAAQVTQGVGSLMMPAGGGGIAWFAHIGGFLAGWVLLKRVAPPADAATEARTATRSMFWPFEVWTRWMRWWWPRR